ncbi:helix-turn-helix transcriptional regulator [Aquiluna sp. Uisw_065]|uniref:helix-turn-helix transcriptional regulator n=1 Tax=Aquiluna sp. Uisw_065 TaxID=3230967 RepID=UPI0039E9DA41
MAAPVIGLSKNDIFRSVVSYAEQGSDSAKEKMFDRDKSNLREMGVQLEVIDSSSFEETDSARYRIAKGSFDWPAGFEINNEHMTLLELAAKAWNNQLLSKSAQSGLIRLRSLGVVDSSRQLSAFTPRLLAQQESFTPLADAIAEGKLVRFSYRKTVGTTSMREVTPLKLRFIEGQWVLLAKQAQEIKNFLLRRIVSEVRSSELPGESVSAAQVDEAEAELVAFVTKNVAVLKVEQDSEAWWHFGAKDNGTVEVNFMDEALFAEDLMEFGPEVQVLSPLSLGQRIDSGWQRVLDAHA